MKQDLNQRLMAQLPFTIEVLGRRVTFSLKEGNRISLHADDASSEYTVRISITHWHHRRLRYTDGPDERETFERMSERLLSRHTTIQFLKHFTTLPIGVPLLIFDRSVPFQKYPGRHLFLTEAILTWDAMTNWEKRTDGNFKISIPCAGFRSNLPKRLTEPKEFLNFCISECMCTGSVLDPSGLCSSHKRQGAKTLFNSYPLFKAEGFPDLLA